MAIDRVIQDGGAIMLSAQNPWYAWEKRKEIWARVPGLKDGNIVRLFDWDWVDSKKRTKAKIFAVWSLEGKKTKQIGEIFTREFWLKELFITSYRVRRDKLIEMPKEKVYESLSREGRMISQKFRWHESDDLVWCSDVATNEREPSRCLPRKIKEHGYRVYADEQFKVEKRKGSDTDDWMGLKWGEKQASS